MEIGIGIWAFLAYIGFILIWNLVVKRKLAEAMMISWIIVCLLHGLDKAPAALWSSFLRGTLDSMSNLSSRITRDS